MIVFPWGTAEQRLWIRITTTYHVIASIFQYHSFARQDINSGPFSVTHLASQKNYYLSREPGEKNEWIGSQTAVETD